MAINGGCVYSDTQKLGVIVSDAALTSPAALKICDQVKWAIDHNKQIVCNGFEIIKGTDPTTKRVYAAQPIMAGSSNPDGTYIYWYNSVTAYNKGIRAIFSLDPENKYMKITIQG